MRGKLRILISATLVAVVSMAAVVMTSSAQAADSRDCDDNAIIRCGTFSLGELREKYTGDVPEVFAHYGVSSAEVNGTSGTVKSGYVTKTGDVVVGGEVVATDAVTVGRQDMSGSTPVTIDGKTYYQRTPSVSFQNDQLEAYVFFDANGVFSGAVIKSCGNPVKANPEEKPTAACKALTKNVISRNKFSFEATAEASGGAKVTGYVFTVRDAGGTTVAAKTITTSELSANSGEIVIDKAGSYTAKVVVKTSLGDKTNENCTLEFTVEAPEKPSISIDKKVDSVERKLVGVDQVFTYQIRVTNTGTVDLKNVVVSDRQPDGVQFVKASSGEIKNNVWSVTTGLNAGAHQDFTITAKVPNYKADDIKNTACVKTPEVDSGQPQCDDATVYVKPPVVKQIQVCDLTTQKIIWIKESEFDADKHTKDLDKCRVLGDNTIWVCVLETKEIIEIKQSEFDSKKHSKNLNDCRETIVMVQVCDPATGDIIKVKESEAGNYKPVNDPACDEQKPTSTIPSTGPETTVLSGLVGSSALGLGVTSYMRSRHALRSALRK